MSKRDRRDSDGRDRDRRDDRRDYQPEDEGQRRTGEGDLQEGDSLTALKAILSKVASQLRPLNLSADEAIRLVDQLYGSVLDMDVALAGEADDTRKSFTLAYIQNTTINRDGDKVVVQFPTPDELRAALARPAEAGGGQSEPREEVAAGAPAAGAPAREPSGGPGRESAPRPPRGGRPRQAPPERSGQAPGQEASAPPQTPRIAPEEQGTAEREVPEGPEA